MVYVDEKMKDDVIFNKNSWVIKNLLTISNFYLVDCEWGPYGEWSTCSKTCGGGEKSRSREVEIPASSGGQPCEGEDTETVDCNMGLCPVDCGWGPFGNWSSC